MYVKAFIVNVNKCLKPFFLEQNINIVNRVMLQSFWLICTWLKVGCLMFIYSRSNNNMRFMGIVNVEYSG